MPTQATPQIEHIAYQPPEHYDLSLEVMSINELKRRGSEQHFRLPQYVEFYLLIGVTGGTCTHMIDFAQYRCRERSWLVLRPGQIQRFDFSQTWEGWLIAYSPEFLSPMGQIALHGELDMVTRLENLPDHLELPDIEHSAALNAVWQISCDANISASTKDRNTLLRHQLYALLFRLHLSQQQHEKNGSSRVSYGKQPGLS